MNRDEYLRHLIAELESDSLPGIFSIKCLIDKRVVYREKVDSLSREIEDYVKQLNERKELAKELREKFGIKDETK